MSFVQEKYNLYSLAGVDGRFIAAVTNKKLLCVLQLEASSLQLPTLHSGSSPALLFTYLNLVHEDFNGKHLCAFKIYGI